MAIALHIARESAQTLTHQHPVLSSPIALTQLITMAAERIILGVVIVLAGAAVFVIFARKRGGNAQDTARLPTIENSPYPTWAHIEFSTNPFSNSQRIGEWERRRFPDLALGAASILPEAPPPSYKHPPAYTPKSPPAAHTRTRTPRDPRMYI